MGATVPSAGTVGAALRQAQDRLPPRTLQDASTIAGAMNAAVRRKLERRYTALTELVPLRPVRTRRDYNAAVRALNELLDAGAANERHGLAELAGTLAQLIADYETRTDDAPPVTGAAALRFLMQQHDLRQRDLPEVGSQGVVSELLTGRRDFNPRQIRALATRFHVNPAVFL